MAITLDEESVRTFYEDTIKYKRPIKEDLLGPVSSDFKHLVSGISVRDNFKALDLGYGYGSYAIFLAEKGYEVHAIDYISPDYLRSRIQGKSIAGRIRIASTDLNSFCPEERYHFVLAKDVLHFLPKEQVEALLYKLIETTETRGYHYIVVFTDIHRVSDEGEAVRIKNEAGYKMDELIGILRDFYAGWELKIKIDDYKESERSGRKDRFYFLAKRITVLAHKI